MEEGPEVGAILAGTVLFLTNYSAAYVIFCFTQVTINLFLTGILVGVHG